MSLRYKLLIIMAIAVVAAGLVFLASRFFGNFLVWHYYLNEEHQKERADRHAESFQQYVVDNKLSVNDRERIDDFSIGPYVDIFLLKDKDLIYAPDWFSNFDSEKDDADIKESTDASEGAVTTESISDSEAQDGNVEVTEKGETSDTESLSEAQETQDTQVISETGLESESLTERTSADIAETEKGDREHFFNEGGWFSGDRSFVKYLTAEARDKYQNTLDSLLDENRELTPIYFVDGTLLIQIIDYSSDFAYSLVTALSIVLAIFVFAVIMIFNFTRLTGRVNRLAQNVRRAESENSLEPISIEGNDELALLATDVNSMRNAVVDNMTKEKQAWEANAGLITAMSHDIRTPLTVLLGYLDLLELQDQKNEAKEYIAACRENTMRLKRLSDDMFSYFLVFGKNGADVNLASCESECIGHMITEKELLLTESGYMIERRGELPHASMMLDTAYFGRVIDNIFSNLKKYADPDVPVVIETAVENGRLVISFKNKIKTDGEQPESNRIGLKTCERIMEQMGGELCVNSVGVDFITTVALPVK